MRFMIQGHSFSLASHFKFELDVLADCDDGDDEHTHQSHLVPCPENQQPEKLR